MGTLISGSTGIDKIQNDAVDIADLSATGTASASTFLCGNNSWTAVDALPTQSGNAGKFLTTDASSASWGPAGKILQVLFVEDTTAQTVATDTGNGAATGLTISITPSSTSSKILAFWNMQYQMSSTSTGLGCKLMRGSSVAWQTGYTWVDVGLGDGGRYRASWQWLDSPATTSAVTYTVNGITEGGGAVYINVNDNKSQLTLMEIAG